MANIDEATRALREVFDAKQTRLKYRPALAGDGGGTVDVADDPGFIWCRYSADQSKVSKVFNIIAPGIPEDFPILVGKRFPDAENEEVLFINWTLYREIITQDTVDSFTTGNHGESHNAAEGNDPAPIDLRNIVEMRGRAQATPDLTVFVEEGQFVFGDIVKRFISGSIDLTAAVPGVAGHRYVLVYVDGVTNALGSTNGTIVPLINTPPIPAVTANTIPICLAQLAQNQTTIDEDDLFDWRFLWQLFSNQAPALIGTNAERLALTVADLAELTRFYTTDTDKIWDVWEGAWRLLFPPAALSESDGDSGTPWTTDAGGKLTGSEDLILDDGSLDSPLLVFRGGSNDDEVWIFLDDDAVAGDSDLVISLVDADGDSQLIINDSGGNPVATIDSNGNISNVSGADIFPNDDGRGLAARFINPVGITAWTVHFRAGETTGPGNGTLVGYSWQGAPLGGTPATATYSFENDYGRFIDADKCFLSKAVPNVAANWQTKALYARVAAGLTVEVGLRLDAGDDDNWVEIYFTGVAGDATQTVQFRYRDNGGGITTVASAISIPAGQFVTIRLLCLWSDPNYLSIGLLIAEDTSNINITGFLHFLNGNWAVGPPTAGRAGIFIDNSGNAGIFDWFYNEFA